MSNNTNDQTNHSASCKSKRSCDENAQHWALIRLRHKNHWPDKTRDEADASNHNTTYKRMQHEHTIQCNMTSKSKPPAQAGCRKKTQDEPGPKEIETGPHERNRKPAQRQRCNSRKDS